MALSDKKILEAMRDGSIVITPFKQENLSTSSYDLSLGEWYYTEQEPPHFEKLFNIYDLEQVERVWGVKARRAKPAKEVLKNYKFNFGGIAPDDKIILLAPGETILAHTEEFIGGRDHITTMMKSRSSLGRSFIAVCKCAGWGDVGYINRWAMEITNFSSHYFIPLVVGRRVAQMVFFETGPILGSDYAKNGKYQSGETLESVKKSWKPEMMLPRLYLDRDIKKK
jgi:dCTP deaminase